MPHKISTKYVRWPAYHRNCFCEKKDYHILIESGRSLNVKEDHVIVTVNFSWKTLIADTKLKACHAKFETL